MSVTSGYDWVGALGNGYSYGGSAIIELEGSRLDVAGGHGWDVVLNPSTSFSPFVGQDMILTVTHQGGTAQSMFDTIEMFVNGYTPGEGILSDNSLGATGGAASNPLNLTNSPLTVGGNSSIGIPSGFNGLIAEVQIYDDALTFEERQQVEYELGEKYGIEGNSFPTPRCSTSGRWRLPAAAF